MKGTTPGSQPGHEQGRPATCANEVQTAQWINSGVGLAVNGTVSGEGPLLDGNARNEGEGEAAKEMAL